MGGAWVIEQPRSSAVIWHPRIRQLWRLLPKVGIPPKKVEVLNHQKTLSVFILYQFIAYSCGMFGICFGWFQSKMEHVRKSPIHEGLRSPLVGRNVWVYYLETPYWMEQFPNNSMPWPGQTLPEVQETHSQVWGEIHQKIQEQAWCKQIPWFQILEGHRVPWLKLSPSLQATHIYMHACIFNLYSMHIVLMLHHHRNTCHMCCTL